MNPIDKVYYPSIDGIRAIAVLAVIFFHLDFHFFTGGYVGVDMFFVVSGYLITRNIFLALEAKTFSLLNFYSARIRRLFPAMLVTIAVSLFAGVLLFSPDGLIRLSGSAIAGVFSIANIRFWKNSGYFDADSISKPLLHLWSLSVEEQFYLFWPIILIGCFSFLTRRRNIFFVLLGLFMASFLATFFYLESSVNTVFCWMPFRAYEFGIGALFALFEIQGRTEARSKSLSHSSFLTCLGLAAVSVSIMFLGKWTPFPGLYSLIPCIGTLLLIVSRESSVANFCLSNIAMNKIGKISYSLYLVHWPLWVFASFWYVSSFSFLQKGALFVGIFIFGLILYGTIEQKFRHSRSPSEEKYVLSIILVFALIIVASSIIFRVSGGLPERVSGTSVHMSSKEGAFCEYPNGDKTLKVCNFGDQKTPIKNVLLLGDSHAMNLAKGLHSFGIRHRTNFYVHSVAGCAPLIDVDIYMKGAKKPSQNCSKFSKALKALIVDKRFDVVMFSARWGWYFEHEKYSSGQEIPIGFLSDDQSFVLTAMSSRNVWVRSLASTVALARTHGKRVILMSQYPLLHKGIGECDKSPSLVIVREKIAARCRTKIPYKKIMQRLSFMNSVFRSYKERDVLPILPSNYFCDHGSKTCDVLTNEGLLYHDENHISALGSIHLIDSVTPELRDFILDEGK